MRRSKRSHTGGCQVRPLTPQVRSASDEGSVSDGKMRPPCMRALSDDNNNGCRMCAPYASSGSELRNNTTSCSVLASMLFTDGDVHDAKSTTIYMAKYMTRDSVEVSSSATVLDNAAGQNREHPSTVDDKDVQERS